MIRARVNALLLALGLTAASASHAALFLVDNTSDSGVGSLREAINLANANCVSGPHTVVFNIAAAGPHTIQPASSLPNLTCPGTVINGYSQPGSSANTDTGSGNNANIQIILNGASSGGGIGFWLHAANIEIAGIAIRSFGNGIIITSTAPGAVIRGNYIGTDPGGMTSFGNTVGISMNPVLNVRIGGSAPADRNLITGNGDAINNANLGADLSGLVIRNNQIGGDRGGGTSIGNTGAGIDLFGSTGTTGVVLIENNFIRRNTNGVRVIRNTTVQFNDVHNNSGDGVLVEGDSSTVKGNQIYSNGTSPNGSGVNVNVGGSNATIESNSIYNNARSGIELFGGPATLPNNTIFGNPWTGINNHATQPVSITGTRSYGNGTASGILFNNANPGNDYSGTPPIPPHDSDVTNVAGGAPNYPEITSVTHSGGNTTVTGFLRTDGLSQSYTIELFSNSVAGIRQGEVLEGQYSEATDANGELTFTRVLTGLKSHITATATRQLPPVATSPYSPAVAAVAGCGNTEVTNTADSGVCSLRAAINYANSNCGGPHTIIFNIPGAGPHTIAPASGLPAITCNNTLLDGRSQPGTIVNTRNVISDGSDDANLRIILSGASAGVGAQGLQLSGSGITVRGMVINGFSSGSGIRVSGVNAQIKGNYIGVGQDGITSVPNYHGVSLVAGGFNAIIGGAPGADANLIGGSVESGIEVTGPNGANVSYNLIGATRTGLSGNPNQYGIMENPGNGNSTFANNRVAFNSIAGIYVRAGGSTVDRIISSGNGHGLIIDGPETTVIDSQFNNNGGNGIWVIGGIGNRFYYTAAFANSSHGMLLGPGALVPNDEAGLPYDSDSGANNLVNHPVITLVTHSGGNTVVQGRLRAAPVGANVTLQFFSNTGTAGVSSGEIFIESKSGVLDASGEWVFIETLTGLHSNISATATVEDCGGACASTSIFSPAIAVSAPSCGNTEVTNTADSGACSLRAAITYANSNCGGGPHTITFSITGTGPHRIQPVSPLPTISCDTTVIDGYSQPGSAQNAAAAGQTNANIQVWLDGALAPGGTNGFVFDPSSGWTVRGLAITRFDRAVSSRRPGNLGGNFLGVEPDGVSPGKNNYGVFWDIGGDPQFGGTVGGANLADVNLISANNSGVATGNAVFVSVRGNLFGHDRNGSPSPSLGWTGNGVSNGTCDSGRYDFVYDNFFAHVQTAGSSSCGHWEFVGNRIVLGDFVIGSPFAMSFSQRFTRISYNISTSSTTLEGTFDGVDAVSNHKLQFFGNPGLPLNSNSEWLRDLLASQDLIPAAAGSQPFTYTHAGLVDDPSLMRVVFGSPRLTYRAFQYRKPLTLSALPTAFNVTAGAAVSNQTLTITNRFPADSLSLTGLVPAVSGSGFSLGTSTCGASLPPLGSCTIQIGYARATAGSDTGTFTLELPSTLRNSAGTSVLTIFSFDLSGTATAAPGPVFMPSSTSFNFAPTAIGLTSAIQTLTITNSGGTTMNISGATLVPAGDFTSGTTCGTTLAPLASCTVTFTFSPTATGIRSASKTITTDAPGSPHVITLNGTGVAAGVEPTVSFAPSSISVGGNSTLSITLTNTNASAANVNPVSFTYPAGLVNAAVPAVSSACGGTPTATAGGNTLAWGSAITIVSGGTCTLSATVTSLTPTNYTVNAAAGAVTSDIGSNALAASATLTVTPATIAPVVTYAFAPASILTGATSTVTITISNGNAVAMTASGFTLTHPLNVVNSTSPNAASTCVGGTPVATPGASTLGQAAGFTLPPSGTCSFSVDVTSTVANVYTASVPAGTIVTAAGSNVVSNLANLTVGLAPATGTLTPAALVFGSVSVGGNSATQSLTLTNTSSTTPLSISSISATGPFSFVAGTTCAVGVPLPVLSTCLIDMRFNPVAPGAAGGVATVVTSAGNLTATLGGTGIAAPAPSISFNPTFIDFGSIPPGTTSAVVPVTITNSGTGALSVFGITTSPPFAIELGTVMPPTVAPPDNDAKNAKVVFICPAGSFSLNPGDSCTLGAKFTPPSTGSFNGAITIANPGAPLSLSLAGNGGIGKIISAHPGSIDFGNVVINQQSQPQTVNIVGTGFEAVTLTGVQLVTGIGATAAEVADFSLSHNCTILPPATAGCTATLRFRPGALGPRSADLRISGDFEGGTLLVPLDGTGVPSPVPLLSLSATRFGFGQSPIGSGRTLGMTLSNAGQLPVTNLAISTQGDFNVQHNCPGTLAAGGQCSIFPRSSPVIPGVRLGALIIESNAGNGPFVLPLEATGCRLFNLRDARIAAGACTP